MLQRWLDLRAEVIAPGAHGQPWCAERSLFRRATNVGRSGDSSGVSGPGAVGHPRTSAVRPPFLVRAVG